MKSERGAKSDEPRFVNSTIEIGAKANCFLNRFNPRHGTIMLGDGGMDFVAGTGYGFVSIPWTSVQKVRVDVYGKHVRSTSQIGRFEMLGTNWDEHERSFRVRFKIV